MLWGISTEWWVLYLLIFVCTLSVCILLGLITIVVNSACKDADECALRSLDISNIYKLLLGNKAKVEDSKPGGNEISSLALDMRDNIDKKFSEIGKLLSSIESILKAEQVNGDEISKTVSDINTEIQRGIHLKFF